MFTEIKLNNDPPKANHRYGHMVIHGLSFYVHVHVYHIIGRHSRGSVVVCCTIAVFYLDCMW